jgi:hypothetical protein
VVPDTDVPFPRISHVRQIDDSENFWKLPTKELGLRNEIAFAPNLDDVGRNSFNLHLNFSVKSDFGENSAPQIQRLSVDQVNTP